MSTAPTMIVTAISSAAKIVWPIQQRLPVPKDVAHNDLDQT
jgi:hypothetical protein